MTNEITIPKNLLNETKKAFANYRESTIEAAACLYDVHVGEAWKSVADSWGSYVEQELGVSQSFASKLLTVYQHYCIEGNVPKQKLIGLDYEKAYLSAKLSGTVQEQLEKAKTLSRGELRLEKNDENPHEAQIGEYCKICWVSKQNHG